MPGEYSILLPLSLSLFLSMLHSDFGVFAVNGATNASLGFTMSACMHVTVGKHQIFTEFCTVEFHKILSAHSSFGCNGTTKVVT
jgi:hypothetical protein